MGDKTEDRRSWHQSRSTSYNPPLLRNAGLPFSFHQNEGAGRTETRALTPTPPRSSGKAQPELRAAVSSVSASRVA